MARRCPARVRGGHPGTLELSVWDAPCGDAPEMKPLYSRSEVALAWSSECAVCVVHTWRSQP
eukprot:7270763-Prymnesium_polylepis.2